MAKHRATDQLQVNDILDRRYKKFGAVRALAAARRPMAMHHFMVVMNAPMMDLVMPMGCRVVPMLCHVVRMAGERPARAVPEPLPVT
jgi:hypothetical protein